MVFLLVLLTVLFPSLALGATINAANCTVAEVQARVNQAAVGDTVHLPTCDVDTWASTVTIDKRIILEGNGTANTILNRDDVHASFYSNPMFHVIGVTGFEMRNMTLDGTRDTNPQQWQDSALRLENCRDFRIHHMTFRDFAMGIFVGGDPLVYNRGLIDHNTFTDNYCTPNCGGTGGSLGYGVLVLGNGVYPSLSLGTAQNVFIEDNTFNGTLGNRHAVASNNGARYVFRYNTITNHGPNAAMVDAHGYVTAWPVGTRQYEIYHNRLDDDTPASHFVGIGPRGGDGVIFNNEIAAMSSNRDIYLMNDYVHNGDDTSDCPVARPTPYQIRDLYIWGNTRIGGGFAQVVVAPDCVNNILLNTDYRFSTSTTTLRPGYVAYTYPHPGQGGASPVADFTSGLRLHLKFDEGTLTTAQDSTANNHDGTLENGATWGAPQMGTSALLLDGTNDQVTVSGLLTSPPAITLAAWVLPSSYGTSGSADVISIGNVATLRLTATQITAHYWNGTAFTTLAASRPTGSVWQHVAYTATAGTQKLYVNGADVATGSAGAALSYTGQGTNTLIGTHGNAGTTTRFGGLIDDARVYTRALSALDIAGLANLEDPPPLSIQITTPTTGTSHSTTTALLANLGGVATDETGVTGVTWNCATCTTTNGPATCTPACGASTEDVNWNIPAITLASGTNEIRVTATDASGTRSDTLMVTYTPVVTPGGAPCTHYASPSGGGNGATEGAPYQIVNFWAQATPGKVLCLLDGTYTGNNSMLQVPTTFAGTPSQPITIRALHDGQVLINGQNSVRPVHLRGNWGILEGINATLGDNANILVGGNDWIVRRFGTWDGLRNESHLIEMAGNRNTIEDFFAFGSSEKVFAAGSVAKRATGNIARRGWIQGGDTSYATGHTEMFEVGYGQDNVTAENILVTVQKAGPVPGPANDAHLNVFRTQYSKLLGSISYVMSSAQMGRASWLGNVGTDGGSDQQHGDYHPTTGLRMKDVVGIIQPGHSRFGSTMAFRLGYTQPGPHGTDNLVDNIVSVAGVPNIVSASDFTVTNPKYGTSVPAALSGSGHSSMWTAVPGICKRYVNGALTTQGLWPWPMNQRIINALVATGRPSHDVTASMESLFGTIPANCKSGSVEEEVCTPPRVGTPPTCSCPAGTVEPNCEPEPEPETCPPDCPIQDIFVIATTGSPGPAGIDTNACTLEAPCATINRARALMTPGDTLYLRGGTYTGANNRIATSTGAFPPGNDWSTPTKIAAYAGEAAILQQAAGQVITLSNTATDRYLVFDRLICDGATTSGNDTKCLVITSGVHHIRWQNGTLRNTHFTALDISSSNSIEILNTTIHGTSHAQGTAVSGSSNGVLFDGVTFHTNAGHGLNASSSGLTNLTVKNSVSRHNTGTGFFLGATNLLATNLLAYGNALGVRLTSLAVDGRLYHATVADNSGVEVQVDAGATENLLTNVLAVGGMTDNGTGTIQMTNYTGDPGFVGSGDYHLALATSPAADAGTCLPGVVDVALDTVPRPQPTGGACDIGAYERAGDTGDPQLPTPGALSARPYGSRIFLVP